MPRRSAFLFSCLAGLLALSGAAAGYTGGPQDVEIVGWDPPLHRVYFHTIPHDESAAFGTVYYLDVGGTHPNRRGRVSWSGADAAYDDSSQPAHLLRLRRKLHPLVAERVATLPVESKVESTDTLTEPCVNPAVRFRVRVDFKIGTYHYFEVVCYHRPLVCMSDLQAIPGTNYRVCVLAFFGNQCDALGETQVPIVLDRLDESIHHVEWAGDR